jgi:hypothetical protein
VKVIFLDIDGVLNCATTPNPRKFPYIIDPKAIQATTSAHRAKVVLSSTWRYDPAGIFSAKHWRVPFIDVIPDMPNRPRRDEVIAWLKTHPKVKRFVVIDDEDDELDQLPLFQPSASTGFTETIAKGVANYLDMRRTPVVRVLQNIKSAFKGHEG